MRRGRWILAASAAIVLAMVAGAATFVQQKPLPAAPPPAADSFDRGLASQGEALEHLGDCAACHTEPGGKALSGGRPIDTPFGTVFATNITPDPATGIGSWSREAFVRAMRRGVARDGHYLYPAFPYDHFTKASEGDLDALYAYLMSRQAVAAPAPANRLAWPFGYRPLIAGWNLLYLREGAVDAAGANRGRALAEGLAHCGSCHTPRDRLGGESDKQAYDGAWVEGWYAPPLDARSPAPAGWTEQELFDYLRTGFSAHHGAAAGPMAEVTHALAQAPDADVRAIAAYFAQLMAPPPGRALTPPSEGDRRAAAEQAFAEGAALFAGACSSCHEAGAPMLQQGRPSLAQSTALCEDAPHDALHVIVRGLAPPAGQAGPAMPAFGTDFTDRQLAEIARYLRARFTDLPVWQNVEQSVGEVRKGMGPQ